MKTLRCRRAKSPITGHAATSLLATKERGASEPMTGMSSQETWLATISRGRRGSMAPRRTTLTPRIATRRRWNEDGEARREGPAAAQGEHLKRYQGKGEQRRGEEA